MLRYLNPLYFGEAGDVQKKQKKTKKRVSTPQLHFLGKAASYDCCCSAPADLAVRIVWLPEGK